MALSCRKVDCVSIERSKGSTNTSCLCLVEMKTLELGVRVRVTQDGIALTPNMGRFLAGLYLVLIQNALDIGSSNTKISKKHMGERASDSFAIKRIVILDIAGGKIKQNRRRCHLNLESLNSLVLILESIT